MSTLLEIESAVEKLGEAEQAALLDFAWKLRKKALTAREASDEERLAWTRAHSSGLVEKMGGTQAYMDWIRGRD